MAVEWERIAPIALLGGAAVLAVYALRPPPPVVIGGTPSPTDTGATDAARLALAERALALAVERDIARIQADAELRGRQYELEARKLEAELERRRIEVEREVAQGQVQANFWGSFWSGLFGLGAAILAGLSDEALYQKAIPDYYPSSGQLALLARRNYYGDSH